MGKRARMTVAAKVFEDLAKDYPPEAMNWVHHAQWSGPAMVPQAHIDMTGADTRFGRSEQDVEHFRQQIRDKGKTKPVVLVKTPGSSKLKIPDGHARLLAYTDLGMPARAYIGTVDSDKGPWDTMHDHQAQPLPAQPDGGGTGDTSGTSGPSGWSEQAIQDFRARWDALGKAGAFNARAGAR